MQLDAFTYSDLSIFHRDETYSVFHKLDFTTTIGGRLALEDVFRNALKKKFGSDDNFDIIINPDKGDMEIWQRRVIVADDDLDLDDEKLMSG